MPIAAALFEDRGGVFEPLVFQEPLDQFVPRVFQRIFDLFAARQHHPRLDLDQRAGDIEKIANGIHVELLKHGQVFEKLVGDRRDRDFDDLDLVLAHQVEQQVERPAEDVEIDEEIHASLAAGEKGTVPICSEDSTNGDSPPGGSRVLHVANPRR